ncbi:DUF2807 domain-containing protein [uncultured Stenotrophomonas sp.]|uniref:GIN domain-containing protein n=1 Tax=uncultured Stenotrophomonas sp. TaxID=165438 RepID=UPI0025ED5D27|nr:DUF2807 domain-containing protein [uncultured Stenotrophomonas sp.]
MRTLLACSALLLLLPLSVQAADAPNCKLSAPRSLKLDTAGAKAVVFEVNQHDLKVVANAGGGQLEGRACASSQELLDQLRLDQRREGDKLVVSLRRDSRPGISLGNFHAWLDIRGSVPDNLPLQFRIGSGDASVDNAQSLSMDVGSGDGIARGTRGSVHAAVGSGDLDIDGASSLNLLSLGSGDVKARNIGGDAVVGTVGSGDLKISDVRGNARLETVGSGDIGFRQVKGNVEIGVVGSGDVDIDQTGGNVHVRSHGSGDITVNGAGGNLTVDHSGSGDVRHRDIGGKVTLPRGK